MKKIIRNHKLRGKVFFLLIAILAFSAVAVATTKPVYAIGTALGTTEVGETETRTYINESGSASTADELAETNISNGFTITYNNDNGSLAGALQIMLVLTLISITPMLLICLTSFTRILIVLHFTRAALNTQSAPPNNVMIALALFLTFYIMNPVITEINENAWTPFINGEIEQAEALEIAIEPLREFMAEQTMQKDAKMFCDIAGYEWTGDVDDIPISVLIPSFLVSELRTAFIIGFVIYLPFVVIDMVVASCLMSMGMMMLPPTTISMPFKILLFVLADGWNLVIVNLVKTFY